MTWRFKFMPSAIAICPLSFGKLNLPSSLALSTDTECIDFVSSDFPDFLDTYLSYPPGILRADIWRVLVLYRYGGVYADIDVECLRPLEELLAAVGHDDWDLLLTTDHPIHERIHFGGRTMWMNDFMIAKPGSRFLGRVIEEFRRQAVGRPSPADAVMVTGPGLFTRLVEAAGGPEAAGVTTLPWQWVHPLPDMSNELPEKAGYLKMIRERTWRDEHDPYVVHYWHHTWCRAGNMLSRWGHLLHQTDGEIVERRLWKVLEGEDAETKAAAERAGRALAEFAETGEKAAVLVEPCVALVRLAAAALAGLGREVWCVHTSGSSRLLREAQAGVVFIEGEGEVELPPPVVQSRDGKLPLCGPTVVRLVGRMPTLRAGLLLGSFDESGCVVEGGLVALSSAVPEVEASVWEHLNEAGGGELVLLRRRKPVLFPIPRVLHLLPAAKSCDMERNTRRWEEHCEDGWQVRVWSMEEVESFMREETGSFFDDWLAYKSERARMVTARYWVLARLGGVAVEPDLPLAQKPESLLAGHRLVFGGRENTSGAMLEHLNAVDYGFMASEPGHPFWTGLEEDLSCARGADASGECGNAFLTRRVRDGLRFWKKEDHPVVMRLETLLTDLTPPAGSVVEEGMVCHARICREHDLRQPWFHAVLPLLGEQFHPHRKLWEFVFIYRALQERGLLAPGKRGVGFGVGREPMPAAFAASGCLVVATDLAPDDHRSAAWAGSGQHSAEREALNERKLCPAAEFKRLVHWEPVDMNRIPAEHHGQFDFTWSSCALEHCGTLELAKRFILEQARCLKPGGVAVHTTEMNLSSEEETLTEGATVLFRKSDLAEVIDALREGGFRAEMPDLKPGEGSMESYVDAAPCRDYPHLRFMIEEYVSTSVALIIERPA